MRVGLALALFVTSLGFGQTPKITLFSVNKVPVYTDEFIYLYKKNHLQPGDYSEAKISEYLSLYVNFKLKIAEAHKRGYDTTAAFTKEFNSYKSELRKPYEAGTDDVERLTRETYERLKDEVSASHILVLLSADATPADTLAAYKKISEIRKRAVAGEDFAALARENSDDPSAKNNGGDLGFFTALQMVYPFENAAYNTKVGDISPIVKTRFGYHIVKVNNRRPSRGEVEVSHILIRTTKPDDVKARNTIFEVFDQLKGGRPWDELCKEYSEDQRTKDSGGRLKPFDARSMTVPEFQAVAFSLKEPGQISDPFQSSVGWHIVRLERKIPLPPFGEIEASLKKSVARDERAIITKAVTLEKRKKALGFVEQKDVKRAVMLLADSSLSRGKWVYRGNQPLLNQPLFILNGSRATVREFAHWVTTMQSPVILPPAAAMTQLYEKFVEQRINDEEEKKLMAKNPEYRMLVNEYREGILLFEIMEREVWNKASQDSLGQRAYFEARADSFKAGNRVEAMIFGSPDRELIESIKQKVSRRDTVHEAELKKLKTVVRMRKYEAKESQVIDQVSWVPGLQETVVNNTYYLVDILRLVPPGNLTFEEARPKVIAEYQDVLEKRWLEELRKKYPVVVNNQARASVISQLKK